MNFETYRQQLLTSLCKISNDENSARLIEMYLATRLHRVFHTAPSHELSSKCRSVLEETLTEKQLITNLHIPVGTRVKVAALWETIPVPPNCQPYNLFPSHQNPASCYEQAWLRLHRLVTNQNVVPCS